MVGVFADSLVCTAEYVSIYTPQSIHFFTMHLFRAAVHMQIGAYLLVYVRTRLCTQQYVYLHSLQYIYLFTPFTRVCLHRSIGSC